MLLYLYTRQFPVLRTTGSVFALRAFRVAIVADKYCLATLRDHALTELIAASKEHLARVLRQDRVMARCINLVRLVWQTELDCFAAAKVVMVEELANAVEHISECPEFQQLLADEKSLNLELIKVLSKRANSVTRP